MLTVLEEPFLSACLLIYLFRPTTRMVWQKKLFLLKVVFTIYSQLTVQAIKECNCDIILSLKQWQLDKRTCLEQDFLFFFSLYQIGKVYY